MDHREFGPNSPNIRQDVLRARGFDSEREFTFFQQAAMYAQGEALDVFDQLSLMTSLWHLIGYRLPIEEADYRDYATLLTNNRDRLVATPVLSTFELNEVAKSMINIFLSDSQNETVAEPLEVDRNIPKDLQSMRFLISQRYLKFDDYLNRLSALGQVINADLNSWMFSVVEPTPHPIDQQNIKQLANQVDSTLSMEVIFLLKIIDLVTGQIPSEKQSELFNEFIVAKDSETPDSMLCITTDPSHPQIQIKAVNLNAPQANLGQLVIRQSKNFLIP